MLEDQLLAVCTPLQNSNPIRKVFSLKRLKETSLILMKLLSLVGIQMLLLNGGSEEILGVISGENKDYSELKCIKITWVLKMNVIGVSQKSQELNKSFGKLKLSEKEV